MQNWSHDGVRLERTGWRDAAISERHRHWGFDCPAVDVDFLMVEYDKGRPAALAEYKHFKAGRPDLKHPSFQAISRLANGYHEASAAGPKPNPLPFFVARYWPGIWAFEITLVNEWAEACFDDGELLNERDYVSRLYWIRKRAMPARLRSGLSTDMPDRNDNAPGSRGGYCSLSANALSPIRL